MSYVKCVRCAHYYFSYTDYVEHNCQNPYILIKEQQQMSEGKKYDAGKIRMELLSPKAVAELAKVLTFGAQKYDANNWRKGIAWTRVLGAVKRHINAFEDGIDKDEESGLSHLAHAMCGLMFLVEFEHTHKELDDRYKGVQVESSNK